MLKLFTADWKIVVILALPIFAAAMWYGISHHFAGRAVFTVRKWQEWRMKSRGGGRDA